MIRDESENVENSSNISTSSQKKSNKKPKTNNQEMVEIIAKSIRAEEGRSKESGALSTNAIEKMSMFAEFSSVLKRATENSPGCLYFHYYLLFHYARRS